MKILYSNLSTLKYYIKFLYKLSINQSKIEEVDEDELEKMKDKL